VDLPLGQGVVGYFGETGGCDAARKECAELAEDCGTKSLRGEIVLMDAGVSGEGDGGQELLERLVLFPLNGHLGVLDFLEAEVVFQAHADGLVE